VEFEEEEEERKHEAAERKAAGIGRRLGLRLRGYQATGCHKKRMMKMTFRGQGEKQQSQPRGEAAKR